MCDKTLMRYLAGRDGGIEGVLNLCQCVDKVIGSRASANTHDTFAIQLRANV